MMHQKAHYHIQRLLLVHGLDSISMHFRKGWLHHERRTTQLVLNIGIDNISETFLLLTLSIINVAQSVF